MPSSPSRPCSATNATSGAALAQPRDEVAADVDADDVVAEPLQRVLDPRARAQRHLALERPPALEHRDAAHVRCAARGGARRAGSVQDVGELLASGRRRGAAAGRSAACR